jgi:hypothetical protein
MDSIMHSEYECFICGANGWSDPLDVHHVFGGARKKKSEKYGLLVRLCHDKCHIFGKKSVHQSKSQMQKLHEAAQIEAMEHYGWSVEDFIREFGKNYL